MASDLREYEVDGYTFQLSSEDVKLMREAGAKVNAVQRKAVTPENKSATPANK